MYLRGMRARIHALQPRSEHRGLRGCFRCAARRCRHASRARLVERLSLPPRRHRALGLDHRPYPLIDSRGDLPGAGKQLVLWRALDSRQFRGMRHRRLAGGHGQRCRRTNADPGAADGRCPVRGNPCAHLAHATAVGAAIHGAVAAGVCRTSAVRRHVSGHGSLRPTRPMPGLGTGWPSSIKSIAHWDPVPTHTQRCIRCAIRAVGCALRKPCPGIRAPLPVCVDGALATRASSPRCVCARKIRPGEGGDRARGCGRCCQVGERSRAGRRSGAGGRRLPA